MKLFKIAKEYILMYKFQFAMYFFLSIIASVISIIMPYLSGEFIDNLILSKNRMVLGKYCAIFMFFTIWKITVGYWLSILYVKMQARMAYRFNMEVIKHIQDCSITYIKKQNITYLNNKVNNDCNAIIIYCLNTIQEIVIHIVTFIFPVLLLIYINYKLLCVCLMFLSLYVVAYFILRKKIFKLNFEVSEHTNLYFARLQEQLNYSVFARLFGIRNDLNERITKVYTNLEASLKKKQKLGYFYTGIDEIIRLCCNLFIYLYGGISIISGTFTVGQYTMFISYFNMLMATVRFFFDFGKNYQNTMVSYNRVVHILNEQSCSDGSENVSDIQEIVVKNWNVVIGNKEILDNFNLHLKKGKVYGIIGGNGSGKTTLLNSLLGVYNEHARGQIYYNDTNMEHANMDFIRRHKIGLVEQDPNFFCDSIAYNIFFRHKITKSETDEIEKWLNYFDIYYLAKYINEDLDFQILSGGEKQKLAFIRAAIKNPEIFFLDEPTSAVDKNGKLKMVEYINMIKSESIVIWISHDEQIIRWCDEVVKVTGIT